MLLCRYGWHQALVTCLEANRAGPRARAAAARALRGELPETEPRTTAERLQQIEDSVEVQSNVARSSRLNDSLIVSFPDEMPMPPLVEGRIPADVQQQGFGTRLEPSDARADRPKVARSRRSNKILEKIVEKRVDVVDEEALKEMFEGYDKTAANAADINLEGS